MTERELWGYFGKRIEVVCTDGQVFSGQTDGFTRAIDNESNEASICIENGSHSIELFLSEIASIREL